MSKKKKKVHLNLRFQPLIGKQLMQFPSAVSHDATKDVFQVSTGIDVESPIGLDEREKGSGCLTTFFASKEQSVFSADGKGPYRSFGGIVIQTSRGMLCVVFEVRNQRTKITKRCLELRFGKDNPVGEPMFYPIDHCIDYGNCLLLSQLDSFGGRKRPGFLFDCKKLFDLFEHPSAKSRISHLRFKKLPSDMRPAGRPDVAMSANVGFVSSIFVRADDPLVAIQDLFCMGVSPIRIKLVEAVWGIGAKTSDEDPHITRGHFGTVEQIDRALIDVESVSS